MFLKHSVFRRKVTLGRVDIIHLTAVEANVVIGRAFLCLHTPPTKSICNKEKLTFQTQVQKKKATIVPRGPWKACEIKQKTGISLANRLKSHQATIHESP